MPATVGRRRLVLERPVWPRRRSQLKGHCSLGQAIATLSPLVRAFEHILRSRSYPRRFQASRAARGR
jgi:hypothetical protein